MPSYFSSMLHMNYTDVWRVLRPRTHELVSPDDEIIHSTGRTQHTHSGAWSPLRTGSVPIYNNHHWQPNPCSPSLSFSSSSLPLNEEERQIHRPCGKCADPASMYSSDSSDSGTDDTSDTTFVRSLTAIKIPKRGSSRLSRIMRRMEDSGVILASFFRSTLMIHWLPNLNFLAPSLQFLNSIMSSLPFSWLLYLLPNSDKQKAWHLISLWILARNLSDR